MGIAKRQMARFETGMLQTCEGSEWGDGYSEEANGEFWDWHVTGLWIRVGGVMGMAKRQMARPETGMLQTCEGSEWGDEYSEEADGKVWDWHVTDL
jgi:hypothetical protein